jgi:hypothetical protein
MSIKYLSVTFNRHGILMIIFIFSNSCFYYRILQYIRRKLGSVLYIYITTTKATLLFKRFSKLIKNPFQYS